MSVLVDKLNRLIAKRAGISPEDVTDEFLDHWLEGRILQEDDTNPYGGRTTHGLEHLTEEQVKAALQSFKEMLEEDT